MRYGAVKFAIASVVAFGLGAVSYIGFIPGLLVGTATFLVL